MVKFGRIDKEKNMRLLKQLPINIVIIPTIISLYKG
jgi:hypothetical protein